MRSIGSSVEVGPRRERGGVAVWILMMLPVVMLFVGVTWDAGNLLALQREADNIAGSAARAGAQAVDEASIYASAAGRDGRAQMDTVQARIRAETIGSAQGATDVVASFESAGGVPNEIITVTLLREYEPTFLAVLGFGAIQVEGEATVRVRSSVQADQFNNDYSFLED